MGIRKSFVLYTQISETLKELSDAEKGQLFQAIIDYAATGEVPDMPKVVRLAFVPIRQDIDLNVEKWEKTRLARSAAGKRGAEQKQANASKAKQTLANVSKSKQTLAKQAVNVNDNVNVNVNVINNRVSKDTLVKIVNDFNATCPSFPKVSRLTDTRKQHLKARLAAHSEDELHTAFWKIEQSDFARSGSWCGFDWLIKSENNLLKVLEGNYDNKERQAQPDKWEKAIAKIHDAFGGEV